METYHRRPRIDDHMNLPRFSPISRSSGGGPRHLAPFAALAASPATAQQLQPPASPGPATPPPTPLPLTPPADDGGLFSAGFFMQLGFSFIVGLAVGYGLKVAFKIALVISGLLLTMLFSLQYAGIIEVNWSGMESHYDGFAGWLTVYAGVLKDFMADNLSNAASFGAGLIAGLRL